jgi:hypothetical protein
LEVFALLLLACGPTKIELGQIDTGFKEHGDDSATEIEDSDSPPDDSAEPPIEGDYAGWMEGLSSWEWDGQQEEQPCDGEVSLEVTVEGSLSGSASCHEKWQRTGFDGTIVGRIDGKLASGTWTVYWGWDVLDLPLDGTLDQEKLTLTTFIKPWEGYTFEGTMQVTLQGAEQEAEAD